MKKQYKNVIDVLLSVVVICLVVWGIFFVYNRLNDTNKYIRHLEVSLKEEQVKNDIFEDLVDLAIDNARLDEEIEWYEENVELIEWLFELEAENEFLEERLELANAGIIVDIEPVIEYVEVIVIEYIELEHPNHQDYLNWLEEYEDLIDDFIDELYRRADDDYDLAYGLYRYYEDVLESGGSINATEVEFMMEYQENRQQWLEFHEWVDETLDPIYMELMDRFPVSD